MAVNDAPTVTLTTKTRLYKEKAPQVYVDPGMIVRDVDSSITSASVTLTPYYENLDNVVRRCKLQQIEPCVDSASA